MALQTNTNVSPYYDDWEENKNYHRVMFKAGYPVQARELTQSQTILQDQIEKLASKFLKNGEQVQPGEFSLINPAVYVRLSSITQGATVDDFVGYYITGATSGVKARVMFATPRNELDDATFYISYVTSGSTSEYTTFLEGEVLESDNPNFFTATVGITNISKPISSPALGFGVLFNVTEGTYFVNGFMVNVENQTILVEKYNTKPSCLIGFTVDESFITSNQDLSLLDNSQGSSNFAAPGADRLKITLTLTRLDTDVVIPNFIRLATLLEGNIEGTLNKTVKWDWLFDILAKRTFEESGNYVIEDFVIKPLEYANVDDINVDGFFEVAVDADGEDITDDNNNPLYPPVPPKNFKENLVIPDDYLTFEEASAKYVLNISPGQAYVQGYDVGYSSSVHVFGDKARSVNYRDNSITALAPGLNVSVTNVFGNIDIQNISTSGNALAFDDIIIYRSFTDGYVGDAVFENSTQSVDFRPLNRGKDPWTTFHIICDGEVGETPYGSREVYRSGNSVVIASDSDSQLTRGSTIGGARILVSTKVVPYPAGVMRPRYLRPNGIVDNGNGFYGYNSTYNLGVVEASFFTEFAVDTASGVGEDIDWVVGDLVYGEESEAFGLVESGSRQNGLVLSNIIGRFISGEVITQTVNGVTKEATILREGEVVGFAFTDAGPSGNLFDLSGEDEVTVTALGASITLTSASNEIECTTTEIKLLKAGRDRLYTHPFPLDSPFRTTRVNYEVETKNGAKGYAIVIPGKITNTLQKAKSFFSELDDYNNFSADISVQNTTETDILSVAQNSTFTGVINNNYITCDSLSGDPSEELVYGDIVTMADDNGVEINKMVHFATKPVGYGNQRSSSRVYFTTTLNTAITGKNVQRVRLRSRGSVEENLIYKLPQHVVKNLETDPLTTGIDYQVYREFFTTIRTGDTSFVLSTGAANEQFISNNTNTTVSICRNLTRPQDDTRLEGMFLTVGNYRPQDNNSRMIFDLTNSITDDCTIKIITAVQVTNAVAKRKIFRENVNIRISADNAAKEIISLGVTDGYKLKSVVTASGVDITNNYLFDNGQRDNIYDIARLVLKPKKPTASEELIVIVDYFDHTSQGDFFSVNSYTDQEGIPYPDIPTYYPPVGIPNVNTINSSAPFQPFELRDCIDFRPIVNTKVENGSVIAPLVPGVDSQNSHNFRDKSKAGNGFAPRLPVPDSIFLSNIEYYLPQWNSLFLEKSGALSLVAGQPSEEPQTPPDIAEGIRLYDIFLPAYTFGVKDIKIKKYNYKRYRMKDISSLDKRIERIEDIISLTLLEQSALGMSVRDAVTGLDRFKNGIIVDNFSGHSKGNVYHSQYRNSIDPKKGILRAPHFTSSVKVEEAYQTDEERFTLGSYSKTETGIATVPYEPTKIIDQPFATRTINLQPYAVFSYEGSIELNPPIDTFQDTERLPELIIEDNSVYDAMQALTNSLNDNNLLGTYWGDWETTGTSNTSSTRISESGTRGQQPWGTWLERTTTKVTTTSFERQELARQLAISTGEVRETSYGDRVVDVSLAKTMRSIAVFITAGRMKPNTRLYAFFDGKDVSDWVSPDTMVEATKWPDGVSRYAGKPNTNPGGFGLPLVTDATGNFSGVFLIPNGRPPEEGYVWKGNINDVVYRTSGTTRSFTTGTKTFRLTSDYLNRTDDQVRESYCETNFVSSGVIQDKQETIVSTRLPSFSQSPAVVTGETSTKVETSTSIEVSQFDPVAQSFQIDSQYSEGCFVTELDVFFDTKDPIHGCEAYLVTTDAQVPTQKILPHSRVIKNSDTTLRVQCKLGEDINSVVLSAGVTVVGAESGATGIIKSNVTFENEFSNETQNVKNKVYNVILSNYMLGNANQNVNNEFFPGEEIIPQLDPALTSTFRIVNNEYNVIRLDLKQTGSGYTDQEALRVNFSEPELPGGRAATGVALMSDGMIYDVKLTDPGSGYVKVPSVTIDSIYEDDGEGAEATVRVSPGTPGVVMGCATSNDATAPTKFKFHAPVYLRGNTWYAFVVKSPSSLEYRMWTCQLGEFKIGTRDRVFEQPNLGSVFKSQNGGLWTEDQTQDIKFTLRRAKFNTESLAAIRLVNSPLDKKVLEVDAIETSGDGFDSDSEIFGENSRVVKVYHTYNGLAKGDYVALGGVVGDSLSRLNGIPLSDFNGIHKVLDADLETFTIMTNSAADVTGRAGGNSITSTFNRPYEVCNLYTGLALNTSGRMNCTVRSTQASGVTHYNEINQYQLDNPVNIIPMESYYFDGAKLVAHPLNESKYSDTYHLRNQKSFETVFYLTTQSDAVSPVVDLVRTDAILTRNLIDNPYKYGEMTGFINDIRIINRGRDYVNPLVTITGGGGSGASAVASVNPDGTLADINIINGGSGYTSTPEVVITDSTGSGVDGQALATLSARPLEVSSLMGSRSATIKFSGDFDPSTLGVVEGGSLDIDNLKLKLTNINRDARKIKVTGNAIAKINERSLIDNPILSNLQIERISRTEFPRYFTPEEKENGSVYAKWISDLFVLENDSDGIEIKITAVQYAKEDIRVYFKPRSIGFDVDLNSQNWIAFNGTGLPNDVENLKVRSTNYISPDYIDSTEWKSITFSVQDLAKFDALMIKIVMSSDNPAKAPLIDDFQLICSE